jgi:hypothetical protein
VSPTINGELLWPRLAGLPLVIEACEYDRLRTVLADEFERTLRREEVNGQPGAMVFDREGRLISVATLDIAEGQIQGVSAIVHPDKLRHLGPVGDLGVLLRERS